MKENRLSRWLVRKGALQRTPPRVAKIKSRPDASGSPADSILSSSEEDERRKNERMLMENFQSRSVVARTPTKEKEETLKKSGGASEEEEENQTRHVHTNEPGQRKEQDTKEEPQHTSPKKEYIVKLRKDEEEALHKCKAILEKMKVSTLRQKNISMGIKNGLAELEEALEVIESLRGTWKAAELSLEHKAKEAAKMVKITSKSTPRTKRDREALGLNEDAPPDQQVRPSNKRRKEGTSVEAWSVVSRRKQRPTTQEETMSETQDEWKTVKGRKKAKMKEREQRQGAVKNHSQDRRKKDRMRPEAVIIKLAEGKTYADVLQMMRQKVMSEQINTEIRSIRQTQAGNVLVELSKEAKDTEAFRDAVKQVVGEVGEVKGLIPRASIEIRDLDSLTTEDEIKEAIAKRLKEETGQLRIFLTKPNTRQQRLAVVEMNERAVKEIMETARIKVAWVNCRIKRRTEVIKCYKCMGYGHQARDCKGSDRSGTCFKCGGKSLKAANHTSQPHCNL